MRMQKIKLHAAWTSQKPLFMAAVPIVAILFFLASSTSFAEESNYWAEFAGSYGTVSEVGPGYVAVGGQRLSLPAEAPVLDVDGARLSVSALKPGQWVQLWFNPAVPPDRPVLERIVIRSKLGE